MEPVFKTGGPMFTAVAEMRVLETKSQFSSAQPLHLKLDFVRDSYFTETSMVGNGPATPRYSFTDAVRKFII